MFIYALAPDSPAMLMYMYAYNVDYMHTIRRVQNMDSGLSVLHWLQGASVVLYRNADYRKHQIFSYSPGLVPAMLGEPNSPPGHCEYEKI